MRGSDTDTDDTDDECVNPFVGWEKWFCFSLMLFVLFGLCVFVLPILSRYYRKGLPLDPLPLPTLYSSFLSNLVFVVFVVFLLSVYPCAYGGLEVWLFFCSLFAFFPSFGSYCFEKDDLNDELEEGKSGKWYIQTYHLLTLVLTLPFIVSFSMLDFILGALYLLFAYSLPSATYLLHLNYPSPKRTSALLAIQFFLLFFLLCLFYQEARQTWDVAIEKRDSYFALLLYFSLPINLWGYSLLRWGGWFAPFSVSSPPHPHQKFLLYSTSLALSAFILSSCVIVVFMGFPALIFNIATLLSLLLFFFSLYFGAQDYAKTALNDSSPSLSPARLFFHTPGLLFLGLVLVVVELFDFERFTSIMSVWLVLIYHITTEGMLAVNGIGRKKEKNGGGDREGGKEEGSGNESGGESGERGSGGREGGESRNEQLGGVEVDFEKREGEGEEGEKGKGGEPIPESQYKGFGSDDTWEMVRNSWDDGGLRERWERDWGGGGTGGGGGGGGEVGSYGSYDNLRTPSWDIVAEGSESEEENEGPVGGGGTGRGEGGGGGGGGGEGGGGGGGGGGARRSRRGSYGSGEGEGEGERTREGFVLWWGKGVLRNGEKKWGYLGVGGMMVGYLLGFWLFMMGVVVCDDWGLLGFLLVFAGVCMGLALFLLYFVIFCYYEAGDCGCGRNREETPFVEEGELGEMAGERELLVQN